MSPLLCIHICHISCLTFANLPFCLWNEGLLFTDQLSVLEGAGIDAHGTVIGVQDKSALGKGKIHLPHHKGVINGGQQLAAVGIPHLYGELPRSC